MKIYTKKGDKGKTSLIGGTRVAKDHLRIEAYGTVDELNSWIGMLRDRDIQSAHKTFLVFIQDRLFTIGSHLASDPETSRMKLPELREADVVALEKEIDSLEKGLPVLKSFLLPGGHPDVSCCHVVRCVCRRAERTVVHLSLHETVEPLILKFLNRLSDYLFVLSRKLAKETGTEETLWKPGKAGDS